ncbi:MAG TPA: DNA-binding response regulator [Clostridiaceae bacterium]|nr:DNA-binding response regulator [Clostridiaceae bacterium]
MEHKKILIIEDEEPISDLLSYSLKKEGFYIRTASDGSRGLMLLQEFKPDLIILDIMLPDISGFDICKKISNNSAIPVVMITAKSDTVDKILGIELGADDYITKPFDVREVIARIKALFRRIELTSKSKAIENDTITLNDGIEIHKKGREVLKNKKRIELTGKEYDLLLFLAENKGRVISRNTILDKVWDFEFLGDTRTVDIHIQRIRKKLDEKKKESIIETIFGIGYKLVDRVEK